MNMMDFGVSQHLAMFDESNRSSEPDKSLRSCASLDELIENSGDESVRSLETQSEADLDDYVESHGFMNYWPLTCGSCSSGSR